MFLNIICENEKHFVKEFVVFFMNLEIQVFSNKNRCGGAGRKLEARAGVSCEKGGGGFMVEGGWWGMGVGGGECWKQGDQS